MKRLLFLEDNISGIATIVIRLRNHGIECLVSPDLNAWKAEITRAGDSKFSLLILDDNLFYESTLEKVGAQNIATNGGSIAGSKLAKLIRSADAPDWLKGYKDTPIIIYSVHSERTIKSVIGELSNIFVFEKLRDENLDDLMVEKCIELAGDAL